VPATDGWACRVTVGQDEARTTHEVAVNRADLEALAPNAADPTALVRESFEFLLEREPRESILRSFSLPDIERYFPEYRGAIAGRHGSQR
jgi:hypothetical protein